MPVSLPAQFGKYQLLAHIAEGGMADVYLARLTGPGGFEKRLVVKVIRPELAERREFCELFVAEAKITVALSHANIVPVYELGIFQGQYFLAMELVDGPTLHQLVFDPRPRRGGPLPPEVCAYIMEQVLRGLDYAHRQGVIHRDLSLANVLVSRDGEVKIVDFGIAAQVHAKGLLPQLTGGSEGYMAPEQRRGSAPDVRADIYAAGVVLTELLSGARFHEGPLAESTPAELQRIVATATREEMDARFPDAAAMLGALSRYLRHQEAPTQAELARLIRQRAPDERRGSVALPRILSRRPTTQAPSLGIEGRGRTDAGAPPPGVTAVLGPRTRELPRAAAGEDTPVAAIPAPIGLGELTRSSDTPALLLSSMEDSPSAQGEAASASSAALAVAASAGQAVGAPAPAATVIFASRPAPIHATWKTYLGAALALTALLLLLTRLSPPGSPSVGQGSSRPRLAAHDLAAPIADVAGPRSDAAVPAGGAAALGGERGALLVEVPPGATLLVDGAVAQPEAELSLPVGSHQITAQAPGRQTVRQDVEVRLREITRTRLVLPWAQGQLRLTSQPAGAAVLLNGAAVGTTPLSVDVPLDRTAVLRFSLPGFAPTLRQIAPREWAAVAPADAATDERKPTLRLRMALVALAQGELTIGALPWAQVYVDGEYRGDTPLRRMPLAVGAHSLRLRCPPPSCAQVQELSLSVAIEPSRELRRIADFRADPPVLRE